MKWMWLFIAAIATATLACSHDATKEDAYTQFEKQQKLAKDFENANQLFDAGRAAEAAAAYDRILSQDPTEDFREMVVYNAGLAYLQSADCPKAAERLRQVVRVAHANLPQLEGRALLRMADVYTCLGQEAKSIATLLQVSRGRYTLPADTVETEIPAKLAGSYARVGNGKEAEKYFRVAERGLGKMQDSIHEGQRRDELSRILFVMGNLNEINTKTMRANDYFSTLRALQKYLLKSVELDSKTWSTQSRDVIVQAYRQVWDYVDGVNAPAEADASIAAREQKVAQLTIAEEAIQSLHDLKNDHLPTTNDPEIVTSLLGRLRGEEIRLKNFIATNVIGTNLTTEAIAAQSLKRMGRVLNPDPILENMANGKGKPVSARRNYVPQPIQRPDDQE